DYTINTAVLEAYLQQLTAFASETDGRAIPIESLLCLPGVVDERSSDPEIAEADWPLIRRTLKEALQHLDTMHQEEGKAMANDLAANCRLIGAALERITSRAPQVVESYRTKLA